MLQALAKQSVPRRWIAWSIVCHLVVLFALLRWNHAVKVRAFLPGSPAGARLELSYLPGGSSAALSPPKRKPAPALQRPARITAPLPTPTQPQLTADAKTSSPGEASTASNNALGAEDIRIALTTYSPSPKPDLSRLPHGAQGEVVIDVTIDPAGQVAELHVLQGFGDGIDGSVADTVRTWRFSPATRDGVPVVSVQELHFHYGPV